MEMKKEKKRKVNIFVHYLHEGVRAITIPRREEIFKSKRKKISFCGNMCVCVMRKKESKGTHNHWV